MSTVDPTVPTGAGPIPPPPGGGVDRRTARLWWIVGTTFLTLAGALGFSLWYEVDYVMLMPGSARPTSGLVAIDGTETFPPGGEINFTTVSLRTRVSLADALRGWLDDDIDVFEEEKILGDRSADENREENLALMDTSKQDAIRLALETVGYDVPVTATGSIVVAVLEGFPAEGVLIVGDTITAIEGEPIDDTDDVSRLMDGRVPGSSVALAVESADRSATRDVTIVLQEAPDEPGRGIIGVNLSPREPEYQFPFEVAIDSGSVGGPSAGLAFTLAVIDALTPGDLTGGLNVAVTGEIAPDGTVGPIGGVRQKVEAVDDQGIDVFLVPAENFDDASEKAGSRVRVIAVSTLGEALDALRSLGGSGLALGPEAASDGG